MKSPEQAAFKVILIVAVIIAIAMLPFVARAEAPRHGPPTFEEIDTDADGYVSEEELQKFRAERQAARAAEGRKLKGTASAPPFSEMDSNGDGRLDEAEFIAARDAHMKAMHAQHKGHSGCKGGKGKQHGKARNMPTFADLDLDGNGCIDADEFARHQAEHHGKMHGKKPGDPETESGQASGQKSAG